MQQLPMHLSVPVALLLESSWTDIGFRYEHLTDVEKVCVTEKQFEELKEWARPGADFYQKLKEQMGMVIK